jgi:hypothetical protein
VHLPSLTFLPACCDIALPHVSSLAQHRPWPLGVHATHSTQPRAPARLVSCSTAPPPCSSDQTVVSSSRPRFRPPR